MDYKRQLHNYKPSRFMLPDSRYHRDFGDVSVYFINQLRHTKSPWFGHPFELIDWQEQIIRDLFGILRPDNTRQFQTAYIEIPKKQGKSELAAAVALLLTCCDYEFGGEVYGVAADRNQASLVFDVAVSMVEQCPALKPFMTFSKHQKRLIFKPLNSFYQVLSAEVETKHGLNAHGIIFDELHAQKSRKLFDVMTQGSGDARRQPLTFIITTSGVDRNSIGWQTHQYAEDLLRGKKIDPTYYPVIYSAGDDEDWTDEEVWRRVNPSMDITVNIDRMRAACQRAKTDPAYENQFRQLRLNQWVKQSVRWMPMATWDLCDSPVDAEALAGRDCYAGLDLSTTEDITAFVLVFPPKDENEKYAILPFFWIPEDTLENRVSRDHVPYGEWKKLGLIYTTEGNVVHYGFIRKTINDLGKKYHIREIGCDPWNATHMIQNLQDDGFEVTKFGQGMKSMSPACKELMRLVLTRQVAHGGNKPLRWMFDNIEVKKDEADNIKPDKKRSSEKIDGAVATIMAMDLALKQEKKKQESIYNRRGAIILDNSPRGYHITSKGGKKK